MVKGAFGTKMKEREERDDFWGSKETRREEMRKRTIKEFVVYDTVWYTIVISVCVYLVCVFGAVFWVGGVLSEKRRRRRRRRRREGAIKMKVVVMKVVGKEGLFGEGRGDDHSESDSSLAI